MMNEKITVYPDTQIYIFCPNNLVTGGPEALHQLRWYMERLGYTAYLVYDFTGNTVCPPRYEKYVPRVVRADEVEDGERNVVIVSESQTTTLRHFRNVRRCVWFLSYVYADYKKSRALIVCKNVVKFALRACTLGRVAIPYSRFPVRDKEGVYYLCGSEYAMQKLRARRVAWVKMFVEPISKEFLERGGCMNPTVDGRSDVVLYNPSKPSRVMKKLLKRGDIAFRPLKGYTPDELIDVYRESKLYVDFGSFGGPERIPKESVYNGTCLIVARKNAAVNDFDVAIPERYKIARYNDVRLVAKTIKEVLADYDANIGEFASFREKIDNLEDNFLAQIREIFQVEHEQS